MKSRFISDLQDSFESPFNQGDGEVFTNFYPSAGIGHGSHFSSLSPFIPQTPALPAESFEAEAAVTQSGTGGTGSAVAVTSSTGFTFDLIFDAAAMAAPAGFRAGIEQAASMLSTAINDKITVNINIDYSGTGGGAAAGPDNGQFVNYSTVRSDLITNAAPGDTTFSALPNASAIHGQSNVAVWNAQLKLFGLLSPNDATTDDGSATFATDISSGLLVGVALHELTHALGRVPFGSQPDIFDLFRFTSTGTMLFSGNSTAPAAYFSLDGGKTKLADFGQSSDPSDFLNSGVQGSNDPFDEFYSGSTLQSLTAVDKQLLDALGFNIVGTATAASPSAATSSIVASPSTVTADGTSTTTLTVSVKDATGNALANTAVTLSGSGSGNTFGAISGTTNANGVFTTTLASTLAQNETITATEGSVRETTAVKFVAAPIVIESFGSTSLVQVGSNYFMDPVAGGTGPELMYNGSPVTTGEFNYNGSTWTVIGAEQTATGYEVAWKLGNTGTYSVWATDGTGNYTSNLYQPGSGTTTAFENLELSFQQDLNGDGVIGVPAATAKGTAMPTPPAILANNDTFLFRSDLGSGIVSSTSAGLSGSNEHFSLASTESSLVLQEVHAALETLFQMASGGHDTVTNLGSNSTTPSNIHLGDLHASGFFFH
jgi:serralysin